IWERDEGIFPAVQAVLARRDVPVALLHGSHPAEFAEEKPDLLCVSAGARGWAGLSAIACRVLLLPGGMGPLARNLPCVCAVSYGTSPKDTLTFSSLGGARMCLALQRELVRLDGSVAEQQELVLPCAGQLSPMSYLAAAGVLLLLGISPAELGASD
ncbi:MAG: hypothetical protein RR216_07585, partial [Pseudoflavonifractor sp.]